MYVLSTYDIALIKIIKGSRFKKEATSQEGLQRPHHRKGFRCHITRLKVKSNQPDFTV